jgi:hypothetical protein
VLHFLPHGDWFSLTHATVTPIAHYEGTMNTRNAKFCPHVVCDCANVFCTWVGKLPAQQCWHVLFMCNVRKSTSLFFTQSSLRSTPMVRKPGWHRRINTNRAVSTNTSRDTCSRRFLTSPGRTIARDTLILLLPWFER